MIFGGTWEAVKDKFILAAGDKYSAGSTGGAETVKLERDNMPYHTHEIIKISASGSVLPSIPVDITNQPDWAIKLQPNAIDNVKENPTTGFVGGIGYTGGNTPHNNMPPYEVYYCWKRIA
jgi:microcystin-dependent protein